MSLPKHIRTQKGTFRLANGNETAGNLRKDYPEFNNVHSDTKLETLRERFGVKSINAIREALKKQTNQ